MEEITEYMEQLKEHICRADKVLIGTGREFEDTGWKKNVQKEDTWQEAYERSVYDRKCPDEKIQSAYRNLAALVKDKDYFVITLQSDLYVYNCGLDKDRIVAPCGSSQFVQCPDNCSNRIYSLDGTFADILPGSPLCPECNAAMNLNIYPQEHYCEEGYLGQWNAYQKWITTTLNRNLLLIEAGVDFTLPGIIRFPFEKMAFYNNKAYLYRIHAKVPQISQELKGKAQAVTCHAVTFFAEMKA